MAQMFVRRRPPKHAAPCRRWGLSAWPILLIALLLVPLLLLLTPRAPRESIAYYDPVKAPVVRIAFAGRDWTPPRSPQAHQVAIRAERMIRVGRAGGYDVYVPAGGGGGAGMGQPYLRTGNDLFVPLVSAR